MSELLSPILMLFDGEPTHWCPGCKMLHKINVNMPNRHTGAKWTWDHNSLSPSFTPSVQVGATQCHYFINAGRIQFLGDCKHELAGQTVDMVAIPGDEQ